MTGLPDSLHLRRQAPIKVRLLVLFSIWLIPFGTVKAANSVYVDIARSGSTVPVDTLYSGGSYDFRIWIENDVRLSTLRITVRNWVSLVGEQKADISEMGTYFTWENVGGYGPTGLNTGEACVTVQTGCRMYPPATVWDYSGFKVWEYNVNEVSPDTIGFGGNAINNGLQPGPLQHMVTIHFKATTLSLNVISMLLDSAFISPGGGVIFIDNNYNTIHPTFTTKSPWKFTAKCGDANGDGLVSVGDVVFLINYIFKKGPAPVPLAKADVNNDLEVSVADAVYLINHIFKFGPAPDCP